MSKARPSTVTETSRAGFDWADPFDLESQLSSEERQVRDTARAYARKSSCRVFAPSAREV